MGIFDGLLKRGDLVGKTCLEIPEGVGPWLGLKADLLDGKPPKIKDLKSEGRVVLLNFWTYSDIYSLRDLPYLKRWHEKYFSLGLVAIGIHTPEFDFESELKNVDSFVRKEGIDYPVVLDSDRLAWDYFANNSEPRTLLVDLKGKVRYDHRGGENYLEAENKIRELLREKDPLANLPKMAADELNHIREIVVRYPQTQKAYCGYQKGKIGNKEGYFKDTFHVYDKVPAKDSFKDGHIYLNGGWLARADYLQHAVKTHDPIDFLVLTFRGLAANAILKLDETKGFGETRLYVSVDSAPLKKETAGRDVLFDGSGWSYLLVREPRIYEIFKTTEFAEHVLKLYPFSNSLQIYAFTFISHVY